MLLAIIITAITKYIKVETFFYSSNESSRCASINCHRHFVAPTLYTYVYDEHSGTHFLNTTDSIRLN